MMRGPLPRDRGWRTLHSLWLLPNVLCCGFTTWIGFLYIGTRTQNRVWLMSAFAHFSGAVLLIALILTSGPTDSDIKGGAAPRTATQELFNTWGQVALIALWLAGVVHSLLVRRQFLWELDAQQRGQHQPMPLHPNMIPPQAAAPAWPPPGHTPPPRPITPVPPSAPTVHWPDGGTNPHR